MKTHENPQKDEEQCVVYRRLPHVPSRQPAKLCKTIQQPLQRGMKVLCVENVDSDARCIQRTMQTNDLLRGQLAAKPLGKRVARNTREQQHEELSSRRRHPIVRGEHLAQRLKFRAHALLRLFPTLLHALQRGTHVL